MTTSIDQLTEPLAVRLITDPDDPAKHTAVRKTDLITAITRGLAEYVKTLPPGELDGRAIKFEKFFEAYADPNDTIEDADQAEQYPRFVAWTDARAPYAPTGLSRKLSAKDEVEPNVYLVGGTEAEVEVYAEVWATDPDERQVLVGLLEDAFDPVDWMAGFRLELPHYFNLRATYLPREVKYFDDDLAATQGYRVARITLIANLPKGTLIKLPKAKPRTKVDASTETPTVKASRPIGQSVNR